MLKIIGKRKIWYILSLLVIVPGLISLLTQGLNLGIDFTGGNILQMQFTNQVTSNEIREVVSADVSQTPYIQQSDDGSFLIRTVALTEADSSKIINDLTSRYGEAKILRNELIGPTMGKELTRNAIFAAGIAIVLMLAYIAFRFEAKFAIAAIIPLVQDILVMVSVFSLLRIEVDSTFVAAILTILGYSINNTIVVFDRVRENIHHKGKIVFAELVENSVRQTLGRSINTIVAVLFLLLSLLFLGGETTKNFAFALTVGVLAGLYSSVLIAGGLLVDLKAEVKKIRFKAATK